MTALHSAKPLDPTELPDRDPRRPGLTKDAALVSDLLKLLLKIRSKETGVADYIGAFDVPGSKEATDVVQRGQLRWFGRDVKGRDVIDRISIESFNNEIAPVFVGVTAELAELPGSSTRSAAFTPSLSHSWNDAVEHEATERTEECT